MMDNKARDMILAALLHDIGKFYQRAYPEKEAIYPLAEKVCPHARGRPTHLHAAYTAEFVRHHLTMGWISAKHHNPETPEEFLIALADHFVSSERQTSDELSWQRAAKTPLHAPFSYLKGKQGDPLLLPLASLRDCAKNGDPDLFLPHPHPELPYASLWDEFSTTTQKLSLEQKENPSTWLTLLRLYTSRMPSATPWERDNQKTIPDISLYDHLRITAALAQALYCYPGLDKVEDWFYRFRKDKEAFSKETVASLLAGDLSGIQTFLYNVLSEKALRSLKGRSFFLNLLIHFTARFVLERLALDPVAILLEGGGKFYALLPANIPEEKLIALQKDLNTRLIEYFRGSLYIALVQTPVTAQGMADGRGVWRAIHEKMQRAKWRRFHREFQEKGEALFILDFQGEHLCPICHLHAVEDSEEPCALCGSLITLGNQLVRADGLGLKEEDAPSGFTWQSFIQELLGKRPEMFRFGKGTADFSHLYIFQPAEVQGALQTQKPFSLILSAHHLPEEDGKIRDFEAMVQGEKEDGDKKLMFLRGDVDFLGKVFTSGFEIGGPTETQNNSSFSRMASLSRHMEELFSMGIQKAAQKVDPEKKYLYIIYSGGDDFFIVGRWNIALSFLEAFHHLFHTYTGGHLSFSVGTQMAQAHAPALKLAHLAGESEEQAKKYREEKNTLHLWNIPIPWENFNLWFEKAKSVEEEIRKNKADLWRLYTIWKLYEQEWDLLHQEGLSHDEILKLVQNGRWRWMLRYYFKEKRAEALDAFLQWVERHAKGKEWPSLAFCVHYLHYKTKEVDHA